MLIPIFSNWSYNFLNPFLFLSFQAVQVNDTLFLIVKGPSIRCRSVQTIGCSFKRGFAGRLRIEMMTSRVRACKRWLLYDYVFHPGLRKNKKLLKVKAFKAFYVLSNLNSFYRLFLLDTKGTNGQKLELINQPRFVKRRLQYSI